MPRAEDDTTIKGGAYGQETDERNFIQQTSIPPDSTLLPEPVPVEQPLPALTGMPDLDEALVGPARPGAGLPAPRNHGMAPSAHVLRLIQSQATSPDLRSALELAVFMGIFNGREIPGG